MMHQSTLMALGIVPVPERLHSLPFERPDMPTKKGIKENNQRMQADILALLDKDPCITCKNAYSTLLKEGKIPIITRQGRPMSEPSFYNRFHAVPKPEGRIMKPTDRLKNDFKNGITDIKTLAERNGLTEKYVKEVVNKRRYF